MRHSEEIVQQIVAGSRGQKAVKNVEGPGEFVLHHILVIPIHHNIQKEDYEQGVETENELFDE